MALEVQAAGGHDAEQRLQRRERHRRLRSLGQTGALAPLDVGLPLGRLAVAVRHHGLTEAAGVFGKFEDRRIAVAGCRGAGAARAGGEGRARGGEGPADEVASPVMSLGEHGSDAIGVDEILGRLDQAASLRNGATQGISSSAAPP